MKSERNIEFTTGNAIIFIISVVLGFGIPLGFELPLWSLGIFLLPSFILFYKCSRQKIPPIWKVFAYATWLSLNVLIIQMLFHRFPNMSDWMQYSMMFISIIPCYLFDKFVDHANPDNENTESEQVSGCNGDKRS